MNKNGGRSRTGHCLRDLLRDDARFADAENNDFAGALAQKSHRRINGIDRNIFRTFLDRRRFEAEQIYDALMSRASHRAFLG